MRKMLLAIALTFTASAFAEVKMVTRIDYTNTSKYDDATDTGNIGGQQQIFQAPFNRLFFSGKNGDADVKLAFDFTGSSVTGAGAAYNLYTFVNHFYIQKPFGDNFYVRAGRMINPSGGFEYDQTNMGNQYRSTVANSGGTSGLTGNFLNYGIAGLSATYPVINSNAGGLAAGYKLGDDHSIELHVTNESNVPTGTTLTRKEQNKGLYYTGAFAEKMVEVKAGYLMGHGDTTTAAGVRTEIEQTWINLGVKLNLGAFGVTVENFMLEQDTKNAVTVSDKTNTLYALVDYTAGIWHPLFKYEMSSVELNDSDATAGAFERTAMTLALEVSPHSADQDLRYHIAVSQVEDKLGAPLGSVAGYTNDKITGIQVLAGLKFSADFTK